MSSNPLINITIPRHTLERVSISFAKTKIVLPISESEDKILVAVAKDRIESAAVFTASLEALLQMSVTLEFYPVGDVVAAIDWHFSHVLRQIDGCDRWFKFRCPKTWDGLEATTDPRIRHCARCGKNVHLCDSEEEVAQRSRQSQCVAIQPDDKDGYLGYIEEDFFPIG